ncbi:hypothetical protein OCH7691_03960 [Oceanibacterium hippocampi]|uniref:Uncharacterized protein n=1 Tax=Oceanibacterium hippocampi TaxID=745714 RepID=A0A1Y5TXI0_9PROT|nr:hypothetical protein OCH7691_03960 [Oceanibacterium hippocampi]
MFSLHLMKALSMLHKNHFTAISASFARALAMRT